MSRPYLLLPTWTTCRRLPLLACAALGLRATTPAQTPGAAAIPLPPVSGAPAGEAPAGSAEVGLQRGFLGVSLAEVRPEVRAQTLLKEGEGLQICRVAIDSPAAQGGLLPFDILLRFNDQLVISEKQVATLVENAGPGCEVELTVLRRGKEEHAKVSLCRSPKPGERVNLPSLPKPPSQEEMLGNLMHTFHENPAALETVWRMFHGPLGSGPDGLTEVREQTTQQKFTLWDEGGQVELIQSGASQRLRAWDGQGNLIFDGPCQTPQERAEVPAEALVRLEALEKRRRNLQTPPLEARKSSP